MIEIIDVFSDNFSMKINLLYKYRLIKKNLEMFDLELVRVCNKALRNIPFVVLNTMAINDNEKIKHEYSTNFFI